MRPSKWKFWTVARIASPTLILIVAFYLTACGRTYSWEEDVQLSSGAVVRIHRADSIKTGGPLGEVADVHLLEAKLGLPAGDGSPQPPELKIYWQPMILDRDPKTGDWFVVATVSWCEEYARYGSPQPPYVMFRLHDGKWGRYEISPELSGRASNLHVANIYGDDPDVISVRFKTPSLAVRAGRNYMDVNWQAKMHCY